MDAKYSTILCLVHLDVQIELVGAFGSADLKQIKHFLR